MDTDSPTVAELQPRTRCRLIGPFIVLKEQSKAGLFQLLCARISASCVEDTWVTLGKWHSEKGPKFIESYFKLGAEMSWALCAGGALKLDDLLEGAEEQMRRYEDLQVKLREAVRRELTLKERKERDNDFKVLLEQRDKALSNAREAAKECTAAMEKAKSSQYWVHDSRTERAWSVHEWLEQNNEWSHLDVHAELGNLFQLKEDLEKSRILACHADCAVNVAYITRQDMEAAMAERSKAKEAVTKDERAYSKGLANLARLCQKYAVEMLPDIMGLVEDWVNTEVLKLPLKDQPAVMSILSENRELSHYQQHLNEMTYLSASGARHRVVSTKYDGKPCVLKIFDNLHDHRSRRSFWKEIVTHARLKHPLVVPIQCAFLDQKENRGFLHFDRYECDLDTWIKKQPKRLPHRLGEPEVAGQPDPLESLLHVIYSMIQAVAFVHSQGYVHGDLKPRNWLWDAESMLPRLIDFETAADDGGSGDNAARLQSTTAAPDMLRTWAYTAPELREAGPLMVKTKESDIYALGRSILEVLRPCQQQTLRTPQREQRSELVDLAQSMVRNNPRDRVTALEAEESCRSMIRGNLGTEIRTVHCKDIHFTQQCCTGNFKDGRKFKDLIDALVADPDYALWHKELTLDVVKKRAALFSNDNRRLYCFHEAQKLIHGKLYVRIRQHTFGPAFEKFMDHFSTRNEGTHIHVRRKKMTEASHQAA